VGGLGPGPPGHPLKSGPVCSGFVHTMVRFGSVRVLGNVWFGSVIITFSGNCHCHIVNQWVHMLLETM